MEIIEREYMKVKKTGEINYLDNIEREFEEECKIKRKQFYGSFQVASNSSDHIILRAFMEDEDGHLKKEILISLTSFESMKLRNYLRG